MASCVVSESMIHLAAGHECPPKTPGLMRLLNMKYCPYAQRTRLALIYKQIPHEIVNINLMNKPSWLLSSNPLGKVPVLEVDEHVAYDSMNTVDLLEKICPNPSLTSVDPWQQAKMVQSIVGFEESLRFFYKILQNEENAAETFKSKINFLENELTNNFFGGSTTNLVDYMIWPWFERLGAIKSIIGFELSAAQFPKLIRWIDSMSRDPVVMATAYSDQVHQTFILSFLTGSPVYDFQDQMSMM